MLARFSSAWVVILFAAGQIWGQAATSSPAASSTPATSSTSTPATSSTSTPATMSTPAATGGMTWHAAGDAPAAANLSEAAAGGSSPATGNAAQLPGAAASSRPISQVATGSTALPSDGGQVWREYDISPYTVRVTSTKRPEQAVIDWILQETGYEAWHFEPLGVLSASSRTLRVYHTPEMQAVVADLVERFVSSEAETDTFNLRVITVDQPNWRARAQRVLRPVSVQTPGVMAWLLAKEEAASVLADLRRRSDYREHSSPYLMVNNGQSTVVSSTRGQSYVRDVLLRPDVWPGFEADMGQVDEGFSLEFCPLLSVDRQTIDAVIKCEIDQVEKIIPVMVDVPTSVAPRQRTKLEVPQITHFRFHERFRWPAGQVLLIDMGMVAVPVPIDSKPLVPGLPISIAANSPRAEMLVLVEAKGKTALDAGPVRSAQRDARTYRGRY